jgi:pSer/pThr/pTyr-binding forkhead associated (FHA) protein
MAIFWVQVSEPGHSSRVVPIRGRIEAGRDCDDLLLESPIVSRHHLSLEPVPDGLICVDLNSANGTFVNDERIGEPVVVRAGDVIRLGEIELIVYQGHETAGSLESADSAGTVIDLHERPSEARRDLKVAMSRSPAGQGRPPAPERRP